MKIETRSRINREYSTILPVKPERVFPLLCPVREYDWIPHWKCQMLYSVSGYAELGCIFTTNFDDEYGEETWVVSHYEPPRKIAFVRLGAIRSTRYEVTLCPEATGHTKITWRNEITALQPEAGRIVEHFTTTKFTMLMKTINTMLADYLSKSH